MLFRLGFFEHRPLLKVILGILYLFGCEILGVVITGRNLLLDGAPPIFFISVFLLFLYILFRDKIVVYLKEPLPKLSLRGRGLSAAERSYVLELAKGRSLKEIAFDYEVSESTVRNTLSRAYRKLGTKDMTELVALAATCEFVE